MKAARQPVSQPNALRKENRILNRPELLLYSKTAMEYSRPRRRLRCCSSTGSDIADTPNLLLGVSDHWLLTLSEIPYSILHCILTNI